MRKNRIQFIFCVILFSLFILISTLMLTNKIVDFDNFIYSLVIYYNCEFLNYFFIIISEFSSAGILILLTILIMLELKNKKISYLTILNLLCIIILNLFLKNIFIRERPLSLMLVNESGYSFPSGHSMVSLGFYGYIIYLLWKDYIKTSHKKIASVLISILVLLIGISRIYLGVYYASDVIAGFIMSGLYLIIYINFSNKVIRSELNMKKQKNYIKQDNKRLLNSFKYAGKGIIETFKSEKNMKIHIFMTLFVIVLGFLLNISLSEWIICIILFSSVISLEIVNTAIETVVNLVSPNYNELAKRAKDLAAGAVLIAAIASAIIGIIIFLPKIINLVL